MGRENQKRTAGRKIQLTKIQTKDLQVCKREREWKGNGDGGRGRDT